MTFDDILACVDGKGNGHFPEGWGQGRALFGGLVGAVLFDHLQKTVAAGRTLRSFSLSFVAPATPGAVSLRSEVFREGKSVMQAQVRAEQQGQVVAVMLASFGATRSSGIHVEAPETPAMRSVEESMPMTFVEGVFPDFLAHFDMCWAQGAAPFSGAAKPDFSGYMRFQEAPERFSIPAFIALADAWPPSVLPMLTGPAPASSLTWTLELLDDPSSRSPDTWWQYQVITDHFSEGYGQSRATIWDDQGKALAFSSQTVTVFA